MTTLYFILYLLAAIAFLVAAFIHARPVTTAPDGAMRPNPLTSVNLVALGLLLWVLVPLIVTARAL